jgi:hypothetical protein
VILFDDREAWTGVKFPWDNNNEKAPNPNTIENPARHGMEEVELADLKVHKNSLR